MKDGELMHRLQTVGLSQSLITKALKIVVLTVAISGMANGQTTSIYNYSVPYPPSPGAGYAPNGNLLSYVDNVNGQWSNVQYDGLNGLIAATLTVTNQVPQYFCWAYDSFGNRTNQASSDQPFQIASGTSCQPAGSATITNVLTTPNSSNQIGSTNANGTAAVPIYDAAGNMTFDGRNSYLYDAEGRVCAVGNTPISGGTLMVQYLYDAEGRRVAKGTIGGWSCNQSTNGFAPTNEYLLGQNGHQVTETDGPGKWEHYNVYAGGQLLTTYDSQGSHFAITDPLGTKRVQASAAGAVELTCTNSPFGDGPLCAGAPSIFLPAKNAISNQDWTTSGPGTTDRQMGAPVPIRQEWPLQAVESAEFQYVFVCPEQPFECG